MSKHSSVLDLWVFHCVGVSAHHNRLGQSAVHADGAERPAEQAARSVSGRRRLVQVRHRSSPEGPTHERTPPFERLLGEIWNVAERILNVVLVSTKRRQEAEKHGVPASGWCWGGSAGRGFRMNWHCLYTCICSNCMAICRSAGGAAASRPPPSWTAELFTWLIWMLKGNSWPEEERRRKNWILPNLVQIS